MNNKEPPREALYCTQILILVAALGEDVVWSGFTF